MASVGKGGPSLSVGRGIGAALMVTSFLLLASCNSATVNSTGTSTQDIDVMDKVRSIDILPRTPTQTGSTTTSSGPRAQPVVFQGTEITDVATQRAQPGATGGGAGNGFDLNFDSAPVATVAKVVLGDILQTGYTIDPRVQGTVSLVSVRPVPKSDIIFVLENALRISGVVLVRDTSGYRLTPVGDAVGGGHVDSMPASPEPGYGVSVVPLQYVSAQTLLKLMDSFATKPGVVRADTTRNLLLIQGTGPERRTAVETALSFDVDWMRGQSIGVYPITNSGPEPIIAELEKIVDSGENGLNQNLVKLQPVARLNAVMVVTKKPALLHTVETWIRRLDRSDSTRTSVHVYRVKYGDAKQIARVLTDMFGGGSSSGSLLDSPDNQVAPGSGTSLSGSDRGSFGNSTSGGSGTGSSSQQPGSGFGTRLGTAFGGPQNAANAGNLGQLDKGNGPGSGGQPILQNVRITADVVNNSLLIYADQGNYKIIESALQQVDQPQLQVAIDATIAEVDLTDELQFGVQFYLSSHALGLRPDQGSLLNTAATAAPQTAAQQAAAAATSTTTSTAGAAGTAVNAFINRAFPGFNFLVGQEANPAMILSALHSVTGVKVLSNPSLVVVNNQAATLQVGNQVPISTGSASVLNAATASSNTIVNTVDYRNTGIILHVAPRVSANGSVRLEIEQEISNVLPGSAANALNPTIQERKVKSSISVANGQTVLLAGLIQDQKNENRSGIPMLDQIPGLGNAFSGQDNTKSRTELIIFIRPQIIRDSMDAHTVAEELRSKLRGTVSASAPYAQSINDYEHH